VKVSGLGGKPYRAGDYAYYVHEKTGDNDAKGVGAYLLAASEIQQVAGGAWAGAKRIGEAAKR
jgi:unsaturated rhamnogalacturonyl hydrolase